MTCSSRIPSTLWSSSSVVRVTSSGASLSQASTFLFSFMGGGPFSLQALFGEAGDYLASRPIWRR